MKVKSSLPFHIQHDQFDCGVACLRNILNFYKAEISLEKLREWSGTGRQGTSLLGLHQAAGQAGFIVQGAKASGIADLRTIEHPCILHVSPDGVLQHYVIYYPHDGKSRKSDPPAGLPREGLLYLIGDPAKGLVYMTPEELKKIWITLVLFKSKLQIDTIIK